MKKGLLWASLLLAVACNEGGSPSVEWIEGPVGENGRASHTLVLHNMPRGGRVWFQELYDNHELTGGPVDKIHHYQGTSFYLDIPESGTLTLPYHGRPLPRHSWAPEGFVLQVMGKLDQALPVEYKFLERDGSPINASWFAASYEPGVADIIPRPKRIKDISKGVPSDEGSCLGYPSGYYRLTLDDSGEATVVSHDPEGAYYAQVTLSKLPEGTKNVLIEDWPDPFFGHGLKWRGFMLDVVRDFRTKEEVFKILDVLASYKVNLLHFHLGDDEAWCLEIPRLPELTSYSGHHELPDWDLKETKALKPTANGRFGNTTFFTEEEYKEILQYAWERRIRVVPEFDAPGHSRAAIKAMQEYERRTGDDTYRLQDPADTSHYWTAQDFTDNVLDPDLPGVYNFYGVVFDEVIRMHQEAGVPLLGVHIGGDEVPDGAWTGRDRKKIKDTFTRGMVKLAQERNLKLAGWQEIVENIEPETLKALKKQLLFVNAWSTLDEDEDLPARLANADVPVLLSNVQHAYVDLAYSDAPTEIGLNWGGYVDERKSFALPVYDYPGLTKEWNIVGAEALLWSENIRTLDDATYQMLPKALGIWERAWNGQGTWKSEDGFQKAFNEFYSIIVKKEMPLWDAKGLNYKKR
jgi:hexosaminidase